MADVGVDVGTVKAGLHLGKLSSGQESLLSSDRELTRQRKHSCPFLS